MTTMMLELLHWLREETLTDIKHDIRSNMGYSTRMDTTAETFLNAIEEVLLSRTQGE